MRCKSATEAVTLRRSMREQNASRDRRSTDPETGVASGIPEAAICVQDIDVQCVLQFTLLNAAGCALHRHTSRARVHGTIQRNTRMLGVRCAARLRPIT